MVYDIVPSSVDGLWLWNYSPYILSYVASVERLPTNNINSRRRHTWGRHYVVTLRYLDSERQSVKFQVQLYMDPLSPMQISGWHLTPPTEWRQGGKKNLRLVGEQVLTRDMMCI